MKTITNQTQKADFPRYASPEEQLQFLLQYAILAPSCRNTQPWLWEIDGDEVLLRADRSRILPALDPHGREMIMSCGAALHHLCLAIRAFGYAALVQTFPNENEPDLLARIRLGGARPTTDKDELLFSFITKRHTNRGQFENRALPKELLLTLQAEADQESVSLYFAQEEEEREAISALIERGDLIQSRDPAARRDVADWIATSGKRKDGIPASALGFNELISPVVPIAHRLLNLGETIADRDRNLISNAPVLAVLATAGEDPKAWLAAGQALGRVLLRARADGVWASFFSQTIQVDESWFQLRHMLDIYHYPQLVFRLGYAENVPATPRRSVEEVTSIR